MRRGLITLVIALLFAAPVFIAGEEAPKKPTPKDKCPVCGMFVHKYPDFLALIIFKDGSAAFFDGAKDMFKYYFNQQKYSPNQKEADVDSVYVADYYSLGTIDAAKAYYVLGSDVYGPMGNELIPFEKEAEARVFMKDHKGKSLLRFQDITYAMVKGME